MEWTGARYADKPTVRVDTFVEAPPAAVWEIVSDPGRMPEMSEELDGIEWLDGASGPSLGARFLGRSSHPATGEWQVPSEIVECEPTRAFSWAVADAKNPSALWRFTLEPEGEGTRLHQSAQLGPGPSMLTVAITRMPEKEQKIVFNRLREFEKNMTATLAAIKERVEGVS